MAMIIRTSAWAAAISGIAAVLMLAGLTFHLVQHNRQQGQFNTAWLSHYAGAVAQALSSGASQEQVAKLLSVQSLHNACVYLEGNLFLHVQHAANAGCRNGIHGETATEAAPLSIHYAFQRDGASGLLVISAADQRPPLLSTLLLLAACATATLLCAVCAASWHTRRQAMLLQTQPMAELKQFFLTFHNTQNYRLRAPLHHQMPYKVIGEVVNQMLDELQANENQIHEFAVQIQEKNDQLAAQKRLHQDRNQNLQKMFAGASHDLRQPLQAMMIFVNALKEHATSAQAPLLQKLEQVIDNLNNLFTDLLDISKLESRMTRIPKQALAIKPLLAKIYDEFEALAQEKRIELRLYNRDLTVYSNPNMLERIIRNMLSNAIRYTRTGGVLIGCRKRAGAVWIEVWDTGRGIPQEKMNEIFTEFVQIKDEDSDSNKGVGLGLFIVKRLAQLLDHSIIVTSQLRRGTMFRVVAPSEKMSALTTTTLPPPMSVAPIVQTHRLPQRVLLLDDDDQVRIALLHLLKSWGCDVQDFARLNDALMRRDAHATDLIISDFQLGADVDGVTAISALREKFGADVPALLITGTEQPDLLAVIEKSGIPFLRKPVRPAKLRALLQVMASCR